MDIQRIVGLAWVSQATAFAAVLAEAVVAVPGAASPSSLGRLGLSSAVALCMNFSQSTGVCVALHSGKKIDFTQNQILEQYPDQFGPYCVFGCNMKVLIQQTPFPLRDHCGSVDVVPSVHFTDPT